MIITKSLNKSTVFRVNMVDFLQGDLKMAKLFEVGTLLHWDQLSATGVESRIASSPWSSYVADYLQYQVEAGRPVLALARHTAEHPCNLILIHSDHFSDQLTRGIYTERDPIRYSPPFDQARAVLEAANTLKVDLLQLRLSRRETTSTSDAIYGTLVARTTDSFIKDSQGTYQPPNEVEQQVLQRLGYTPEFLKRHENIGVQEATFNFLHPEYVTMKIKNSFWGFTGSRSYIGNRPVSAGTAYINTKGNLFGQSCQK